MVNVQKLSETSRWGLAPFFLRRSPGLVELLEIPLAICCPHHPASVGSNIGPVLIRTAETRSITKIRPSPGPSVFA